MRCACVCKKVYVISLYLLEESEKKKKRKRLYFLVVEIGRAGGLSWLNLYKASDSEFLDLLPSIGTDMNEVRKIHRYTTPVYAYLCIYNIQIYSSSF